MEVGVSWFCLFFLVTCDPSGLASDFMVNTVNAGAGALSVTIDGPSKVKMDFQECPEGYKVSYTPMAPGNYLISIKYGGPQHIVGSPFKAKVTGEPLGGHAAPGMFRFFASVSSELGLWTVCRRENPQAPLSVLLRRRVR